MAEDCLFCKIASGEIPSYKIYEDDKYLAFLEIFPLTPGHTMVIPKQHFRWVWDVEPVGEYFEVITKIANHFRRQLGDTTIMSMTIGIDVPHAHYHLLPPGELLNKVLETYDLKSDYRLEDNDAKELVEKLALK